MSEEIKQMILSNNSEKFIREYNLLDMYSVCKSSKDDHLFCSICEEIKTEADYPPRKTNMYYCCKECYELNSYYRNIRRKFKELLNS